MSKAPWQRSRRGDIERMVCRSNGLAASDVAGAFRISLKHATDDLGRLALQKRVQKCGERSNVRWFKPGSQGRGQQR